VAPGQPARLNYEPVAVAIPGSDTGLHFVSFTATASIFEHVRRAMDGHYPDRHSPGLPPHDEELGFNSVLQTTHRQNFLVPPRARRSFPLAELA